MTLKQSSLLIALSGILMFMPGLGMRGSAAAGWVAPAEEFHSICGQGELAEVRAFWQRLGEGRPADDYWVRENRRTCLGFAGFNPRPEVIEFLIGTGFNLNAHFRSDLPDFRVAYTPLLMAARYNPEPGVAKRLIEAGPKSKNMTNTIP
jgi:hypothetical protein